MKNKKNLLFFIALMIMLTTKTIFAGTIVPYNGLLYFQKDDGTLAHGQWMWLDIDNNGFYECYYFNSQGYMTMAGMTEDGYLVNEQGQWLDKGVVQTKTNDPGTLTVEQQNTGTGVIYSGNTLKKIELQNQKEADNKFNGIYHTEDGKQDTNIIYTDQNTEVQVSGGRVLRNNILEMDGVKIEPDKEYINGQNYTNTIIFEKNGAFLQVNTKKYNSLTFEIQKKKSYFADTNYELLIMINGEEYDRISFDDEEDDTKDECVKTVNVDFEINDEVDLIMYYTTSDKYSSHRLYITSGYLKKVNNSIR